MVTIHRASPTFDIIGLTETQFAKIAALIGTVHSFDLDMQVLYKDFNNLATLHYEVYKYYDNTRVNTVKLMQGL